LNNVTIQASFLSLSPANDPLLMLVIPIAAIGRLWGLRPALSAAGAAIAVVVAHTWTLGSQIGIIGDLSRATAFFTVAILAGRLQQQGRRSQDIVTGISAATTPAARTEELLSRRELEVLAIIADGATNAEIAEQLYIAQTTVQTHVKNILRKLGTRNRTQAATRYLRG
jgi:DNA-binding CsgD family transcriptional regulator